MARVPKKIIELLDKSKIKYEIIEHRTTYTACDTAATNAKNKIKPEEVVKALAVKIDKEYVLALLSSNKMLDKSKLKKVVNDLIKKERKKVEADAKKSKEEKKTKELVGRAKKMVAIKKVEFAKEAWMKKNIMGKIGAIPPFSVLTKTRIFVDGSLFRQKQLYLGSGEYEFSIKITPAQFLKLEKDLIKGSFSAAKKKK